MKSKLIKRFFILFVLILTLILTGFYISFRDMVIPGWHTLIISAVIFKFSIMAVLSICLVWSGILFLSGGAGPRR